VNLQTEWLRVSAAVFLPRQLRALNSTTNQETSLRVTTQRWRTCAHVLFIRRNIVILPYFPPSPVALMLCSVSYLAKNLPSRFFNCLSHISKKIKRRTLPRGTKIFPYLIKFYVTVSFLCILKT
jgi:hypothetical protein